MIKILNSLSCEIIVINRNKEILFVNKSLLDLLGINEEDVIGRNLFQLVCITNHSIDDFISQPSQRNKFHFCIKNKGNIFHSLYGKIVEDYFNGEIAYFIIGKRQHEKNLDSLINTVTSTSSVKNIKEGCSNEKKQFLVQQGKCIEEMKDEFLTNITHEFRTPINIILSTIQLISSSLENNTYKIEYLNEHIKYLKRNSNRLLRLVNNLIDITHIKNGCHELNMKNYNIIELVENVCNTVIDNEENNDINIIFDTDCEEVIMGCDENEIERVILNLLSNAVKYSFTKNPIIVSIKSNTNNVKISVKDHGVGIPKDHLETVFERLTRVDNNLTRDNEGSGIGLTIVKYLVNLHHGKIEVESEVGKGSNFIITLPINVIQEEEEASIEKNCDFKNKVEKYAMEFSDIYMYN